MHHHEEHEHHRRHHDAEGEEGGHCDCGGERHGEHRHEHGEGHHEGCGCGGGHGRGCCCGREHHFEHGHRGCCGGERGRQFHRRFFTREERLAWLEAYLKELQAEVKAVEEKLAELKAAQ
jgi:hypothetical protein